ncbi:MAG: response regulator [Balneolaceae bacterium]|nr:response regulator [Balneolaceae bacterium]
MESNPKILIVEDELVLQLMLEHMLKKMGFEHLGTATKGASAIQKAKEDSYDLILMDIMLQDEIDGIEAYREIKKEKEIPVIYITGNTDPRNKEKAKNLGYHDYMGKPITFSHLKNSIERLNLLKD